jgi:hypothetical protein
LGEHAFTVIFSTLFFLAFGGLIWALAGNAAGALSDPRTVSTNRLVTIVGGLLGWVIGMVFAPYSSEEKTQFSVVLKTASVFISGYVLGKLERFLELTLFPDETISRDSWERLGLFTAALLLGALIVFNHRLYAFRDTQKTRKNQSVA